MRTKRIHLDELDRPTVTAAALRLVLLCLEQTSYKGMEFETVEAIERSDGLPIDPDDSSTANSDWIKTGFVLTSGRSQVEASVVFKSEPDDKVATMVEVEVNRHYQIRHVLYASPVLRPVTWDGSPIPATLVEMYDNLELPEFTLR